MIFISWRGRGWLLPILLAAAWFLPLIVLRQIDGPAVDRAVALTTAAVAVAVAAWGYRWNRGRAPGEPSPHAFFGIPLQYWALPLLAFAVLLGTGVITTADSPPGGATQGGDRIVK